MKWTPFRVVLGLNLLVIAGIYAWPYGGKGDGYTIIAWAFFTVIQVVANLVLAAGAGVVEALGAKIMGVPKAFLLSAGLTLLISFPLCFAVAQLRS